MDPASLPYEEDISRNGRVQAVLAEIRARAGDRVDSPGAVVPAATLAGWRVHALRMRARCRVGCVPCGSFPDEKNSGALLLRPMSVRAYSARASLPSVTRGSDEIFTRRSAWVVPRAV